MVYGTTVERARDHFRCALCLVTVHSVFFSSVGVNGKGVRGVLFFSKWVGLVFSWVLVGAKVIGFSL